MAKYLTIDIGNSSVKAMAWVDGVGIGQSICGDLSSTDIEHLSASVNGKFDCAAICAVTGDVRALKQAALDVSHRVIVVDGHTPGPIDISAYSTSSTLGADRIAAMAGAAELCPGQELLVVDAGTAVTYDRVSAQGAFLGGNIAPGIGMRLRSLHAFTARLPEVSTECPQGIWGDSTVEAMRHGAFLGVIAELDFYRRQSPADVKVVLTGGRSASLVPYLPFEVTEDPDLVLRGLKHIIEYNENN